MSRPQSAAPKHCTCSSPSAAHAMLPYVMYVQQRLCRRFGIRHSDGYAMLRSGAASCLHLCCAPEVNIRPSAVLHSAAEAC